MYGKYHAERDMSASPAGAAQGYWNAQEYQSYTGLSLGILYREDGCRVNNFASVYAY